MPRPRDDQQHAAMRQAILDVARAQMAQHGTAGLGMRVIARELNVAPSGLYRYFANFDDILTALILDAFNALSDAIEDAANSLPHEDYAGRMAAVLMAYRDWALAHPTDFKLIYGNPIPGYQAPAEQTLPAARRGNQVVMAILAAALAAGELTPPEDYQNLPETSRRHLQQMAEYDAFEGPLTVLILATVGWTRIHGFVMLELYGGIQPIIGDPEPFYRIEVAMLLRQLGFDP